MEAFESSFAADDNQPYKASHRSNPVSAIRTDPNVEGGTWLGENE